MSMADGFIEFEFDSARVLNNRPELQAAIALWYPIDGHGLEVLPCTGYKFVYIQPIRNMLVTLVKS
jgi:hypothetical protein